MDSSEGKTRVGRRRPRRCQIARHNFHGPRSACAFLLSSLLVALSFSTRYACGFLSLSKPFIRQKNQSRLNFLPRRSGRSEVRSSANVNNTDTWSRGGAEGGSRFGVRRRVREVLEKAKNRTGRSNYSSTAEVVAEAASIGGLIEEADLVFSDISRGAVSEDLNGYAYSSSSSRPADLVLESAVASKEETVEKKKKTKSRVSVDALLASEKVDPLPFRLPELTAEQKQALADGERVQEQSKMGREGSGFVVLDIKAPPYVIWECLLDFEAYPEYIGTVRSMEMFTNTHLASSYLSEKPVLPETGRGTRHYGNASISRASFVLSKFHLKIAAIHKYQPHPDGHFMVFTLDRANKNLVMQDAKGIWYTESNPDGLGEDVTRVWLLCEVKISKILPSVIVDYAAKRAMPRATSWLKPQVEEMKKKLHS